ncbi:DUF1127 domain-containing protein [Shimia sediminis]|uniref:DUF1127 domain-containing protein n=1 Tax=Shimia sediminis TaxID=2497945 RepID=UPI000F8F312C|nr:DUF1127 domain-containing protein [Shimia sediminis]
MAYITTTPAGTGLLYRIYSILDTLLGGALKSSAYKRTYRELSRLSDRELDDIGLRRIDIESACAACTAH